MGRRIFRGEDVNLINELMFSPSVSSLGRFCSPAGRTGHCTDFVSADNYKRMTQKVSYTLDRHLSNEVARELLEEDPVETKPELVIEHVREGAVCLLKRWPEMKGKVFRCLNQRLPSNLRFITWKLFLQNTLGSKAT